MLGTPPWEVALSTALRMLSAISAARMPGAQLVGGDGARGGDHDHVAVPRNELWLDRGDNTGQCHVSVFTSNPGQN